MQVVSMKQEASSFRWEQFTLLITLVGGGSVKDVLPPLSVLYGFIFMLSTNNNIGFNLSSLQCDMRGFYIGMV